MCIRDRLEPAGLYSVFHGLRVGGKARLSVVMRSPNSGMLVLPTRMPPARRSRATTSLSNPGR